MANTNDTTNAQPYVANSGNKAIGPSSAKVIAAQHLAAATKAPQGVAAADMALRGMAAGIDLRAVAWGTPDWSYSARTTPAQTRQGTIGAVHVFAHSEALPADAMLACGAGHSKANGSACEATAPNRPGMGRAYRLDTCPDFDAIAAVLDSPTKRVAAAAAAFRGVLTKAVADGYSEPARLRVTPGVAQMLAYGEPFEVVFNAVLDLAAPAKRTRAKATAKA